MIKKGATTIWEEYDPSVTGKQQFAMYGDPFGKSLCHAWGSSPVYLLGRYFMGLQPTSAGYSTFEVAPHLTMFEHLDCTLPIKGGSVHFRVHDGQVDITTDRPGGTVVTGKEKILLQPNQAVTITNEN